MKGAYDFKTFCLAKVALFGVLVVWIGQCFKFLFFFLCFDKLRKLCAGCVNYKRAFVLAVYLFKVVEVSQWCWLWSGSNVTVAL